MPHRASTVFLLTCLACANGNQGSERETQGTSPDPAVTAADTQRTEDPGPSVPNCPPPAGTCIEGFAVTLDASEPWPLGRYFLRVSLDRRPPSVCEIAFEPVVGAVTDTCNGQDREFRVTYRYDDAVRAIEALRFGLLTRLDMEILVAEDLPPVVEVHHTVVVQKCLYACALAAPLVARAQLGSVAGSSLDAGDAGDGAPDATADAAL